MPRTVLIVDDHPSFRAMARALVCAAGFEVVAEAAEGRAALAAVEAQRPDCVLLDVQLPDADGFALAATLAAGDDPPAVVLTSSRAAEDFGTLIEQSPVRGFVTKEALTAAALAELWR